MVEVYYYIPVEEVDNIVECGLKLSKWVDKEVVLDGVQKNCITTLLNPKDDKAKYRDKRLKCLKLEVQPAYCFVADTFLYTVGQNNPLMMELYYKSIIPVEKYTFGSYRIPECLVTSTIIPGHIKVLDKWLDTPILFENSEQLYINNMVESYKDKYDDFYDVLLYYFYCKLEGCGKLVRIADKESNIAIFIEPTQGVQYTARIPDITGYI